MSYNSKTICFGIKETIFSTSRDMVLPTKTICFAIMMLYDAFAKTGPHSSLYEFCNEYVKLYPENKAILAQIIMENSQGNATLDDILLYVNGGSKTVSRELYNYLVSAGLVNSNGTQTASKPKATTTTTKKQGFFSRLLSWFSNLFNSDKNKNSIAASVADFTIPLDGNMSVKGSIRADAAANMPLVHNETVIDDGSIKNVDSMDLEEAYQEYQKHYAQYNQIIQSNNVDKKKLSDTLLKMNTAKARFNALKNK